MKHLLLLLCLLLAYLPMQAQKLYPELKAYCQKIEKEFDLISTERKENLQQISAYLKEKIAGNEEASLVFICTHNSRRSQFAQVWANIAATYYKFDLAKIQAFSGGTEATACNPRTVACLQRTGVQIEKINQISAPVTVADNPRYEVRIGKKATPFYLFSKKYDDNQNPSKNFCAVLVCSQADGACPAVAGAGKRIYHGYGDPKYADKTATENQVYDETCQLIAREILYVFYGAKKI